MSIVFNHRSSFDPRFEREPKSRSSTTSPRLPATASSLIPRSRPATRRRFERSSPRSIRWRLHQIREGQAALAALSSGDLTHGSERESLEAFLAKLPELWRAGEVRPTHRGMSPSRRSWRTRKDPFENVWPEILLWLQADPDSTAKCLMERLHREYPGQFPDGQLRTLQRQIREWRKVMARTLVGVCLDGNKARGEAFVIGAEREA
jgi:hypothetical protein